MNLDQNLRDVYGRSALETATAEGKTAIIELLLSHPHVAIILFKCLELAIEKKHIDIFNKLLEKFTDQENLMTALPIVIHTFKTTNVNIKINFIRM